MKRIEQHYNATGFEMIQSPLTVYDASCSHAVPPICTSLHYLAMPVIPHAASPV